MIRLVKAPRPDTDTVEGIRIYETYRAYGDYALFWRQDGGKAVISMLDGDMVISGSVPDHEELSAFIRAVCPRTVFSNSRILASLGLLKDSLVVSVLSSDKDYASDRLSDRLSSHQVYALLKQGGFELPEYPSFATDYCLRLNKGRLKYFGISDTAVAIGIGGRSMLVSGLVSLEKGCGTVCLSGLLANSRAKRVFVCAKSPVEAFYIKNGFVKLYEAGYWRK